MKTTHDSKMTSKREHAIVIGCGVGGLLAAAAIAPYFNRVTILEQDAPQGEPALRKGVPQGGQAHILLTSGQKAMADLLPGLFDELISAQAVALDFGDDVRVNYGGDGYKVKYESRIISYFQTRPLLEWHVLSRVKRLANVEVQCDSKVLGLDGSPHRITGVFCRSSHGCARRLGADLVIAASGGSHQVVRWLRELACETPKEEVLELRLGYATRIVELRPGFNPPWGGLFIVPKRPHQTRAGYVLPVENGKWLTMLAGYLGDYPPLEPDAYLEYARQLLVPDIYEFIRNSAPCSEIRFHRFKSQKRLYFEKLSSPPAGFVAMGDAWVSLDPLFGQGMTIVAKQAQLLSRLLAGGDFTSRLYYREGSAIYRGPWMLSLAEDLRYPTGSSLDWRFRLLHAYMDRIQSLTMVSPTVYEAYLKVVNLEEDPVRLFHPRILWKVMGAQCARLIKEAA